MSYLYVLVDGDHRWGAQPGRYADEISNLEIHLATDAYGVDGQRLDADGGHIQYQLEGPIGLYGEVTRFGGHQTEALRRWQQFRRVSEGVEAAYQENR